MKKIKSFLINFLVEFFSDKEFDEQVRKMMDKMIEDEFGQVKSSFFIPRKLNFRK